MRYLVPILLLILIFILAALPVKRVEKSCNDLPTFEAKIKCGFNKT